MGETQDGATSFFGNRGHRHRRPPRIGPRDDPRVIGPGPSRGGGRSYRGRYRGKRAAAGGHAARLLTLTADLRQPAACDRVFAETRAQFGADPGILVNNAGLTFTFIDPTRFRRDTPQRFWECGDDIIQAVMDTNYVAADQMARRACR